MPRSVTGTSAQHSTGTRHLVQSSFFLMAFFFFLVASPGTTVRAICVISDFFSKLEFFYMVKLRVVPQRFRQAPKGRANKKIVSYFHDLFSV